MFHLAMVSKHPETIKVILENYGSDKDLDGNTVLHLAAIKEGPETIKAILENCGDSGNKKSLLEQQDLSGNTALHIAAMKGDIESLKILKSEGGNIVTRNFGTARKHRANVNKATAVGLFLNYLVQAGTEEEQGSNKLRELLGLISPEDFNSNAKVKRELADFEKVAPTHLKGLITEYLQPNPNLFRSRISSRVLPLGGVRGPN
jgi:ankyrin repeat protein